MDTCYKDNYIRRERQHVNCAKLNLLKTKINFCFYYVFTRGKDMDKHDLLYDLQHGFREKRSCETRLAALVEDLARNASAWKQTDLVLLDISKAFDKVNHSRLLWKLHQYGVRCSSLRWIHAFLSNRSQTVVLDGEESVCPSDIRRPTGLCLGTDSVPHIHQ